MHLPGQIAGVIGQAVECQLYIRFTRVRDSGRWHCLLRSIQGIDEGRIGIIFGTSVLLHVPQQLCWFNRERVRQFYDIDEADVSFPALDSPHIIPVQVGTIRKRLLRQTALQSQFPQAVPEKGSWIGGGRHPLMIWPSPQSGFISRPHENRSEDRTNSTSPQRCQTDAEVLDSRHQQDRTAGSRECTRGLSTSSHH